MRQEILTRRLLLAGLASTTAGAALAQKTIDPPDQPSIFAGGPFADNMVAREFVAPPAGLALPKYTPITGAKGIPNSLTAYRGKTILLSLWAEWCLPCMVEMPVFDILIQRYTTDKFQIVPVMSSTNYSYPSQAKPLLTKIGAGTLPLIMDNSAGSNRLAETLAMYGKNKEPAIPCNLLIDPQGVIRGRCIGGATFKTDKGEFSIWASADGVAFTKALSTGLLT